MKKVVLIILGFVALTVFASGLIVFKQWCSLVSGESVLKDNIPVDNATVCRCREDILLISGEGISLFVVDLNRRVVGYGNGHQFDKTSFGWFSRSWPITYVKIGGMKAKSQVDPQLEIDDKQIYFQTDFRYSVSATFEDSLR